MEAAFALFLEEMEAGFRDAVMPTHVPFGLVSGVLDAMNTVVRVSEDFSVVNPVIVELRDFQHVI